MAGKDRVAGRAVDGAPEKALSYSGPLGQVKGILLSMRPAQWTKNLLLFLPLAFSWSLDGKDPLGEMVLRALAGGVIFCFLSGGVYIINDILDRKGDRAHPRKHRRPVASGELAVATAGTTAVFFMAASMAGAFLMGTGFGVVTAVFLAMNLGYSSYLKRIIIIDVMIVSAGYLLRAVAGALIIDVDPSPWLYTTIGLGALFIVLGKRYSELRTAGSNAATQRGVLEQYSQPFLSQLLGITATATLVAYALYTFTTNTASNVPDDHSMMLTLPFVVFGLFRYLYLVNNTDEAESPELVMLRDKPLVIAVLGWAVTAMVVLAINR